MPRAAWCRDEIYELFDRWRRDCLVRDGALFSSGEVWTAGHLRTLQTTFATPIAGGGTFFEKLRTQLAPHSPVVKQLGIEIAYVEYVGERDTGAATKRRQLDGLVELMPAGVGIPDQLREILDGGIASYGPGKSYRDAYVRFLLKLARRAKEEVRAGRAASLDDPWGFRDVVASVRTSTDGLQANAVLHACFPDCFDVMISGRHRDKLLRRFAAAPTVAAAPNEERKLLAVREILRTRTPVAISEPYDDAVRRVWDNAEVPEWEDLVTRVVEGLSQASDDANGAIADQRAAMPEPDVDLLERLQHVLGATGGWRDLLEEAAVRAASRGVTVTSWTALIAALRSAADAISAGPPPVPQPIPSPRVAGLRAVTPELAAELLMPQRALQRIVDLLTSRRQIVLYGPPGTGKTWLARRLAAHAFDTNAVELVQFHPSYSYEDFIEGYRPTTADGNLTYELKRGPLRELASRAADRPDEPHLLIIDEINRGNLSKIFGELYFLLEYRDEPLRLQYSGDETFQLPPNLHVAGTMNTADRSIALLDAALRRRFAFYELTPHAEPVRGLLARWLERHGLDPEPHALLETLNAMLLDADGDRDLAIGPSYFMTGDGSAPDLETVWEYDILPLLAERFHGTPYDPVDKFGLDAVRAEAERRADATVEA